MPGPDAKPPDEPRGGGIGGEDWFEDDAFWDHVEPFLFTPERLAKAGDEVAGAIELADCSVTDVLDLCCGPGRHSVELARRGLRVTGVDRTARYLDRARETAAREGVEIEWVQADMREFVRPASFDVALSLFTSFGYFDRPGDDDLVLRNLYESLRPGGALVMELASKEHVASVFRETDSHELADGAILFERRKVVDDWRRIANEWILVHGERARRFRLTVSIYSGTELETLLTSAGFEEVHLFGGLDGVAYGPAADRLVAVARRIR